MKVTVNWDISGPNIDLRTDHYTTGLPKQLSGSKLVSFWFILSSYRPAQPCMCVAFRGPTGRLELRDRKTGGRKFMINRLDGSVCQGILSVRGAWDVIGLCNSVQFRNPDYPW